MSSWILAILSCVNLKICDSVAAFGGCEFCVLTFESDSY